MALSKNNRLKRAKDFDFVFHGGTAVKGNVLLIKYRQNRTNKSRFGFIVSAKFFKKAVARNRIKRLLSEIVQSSQGDINRGYDIVVVVNRKAESEDMKADLKNLLSKLND